ncbi:MAG TPA: response regulator [Oligoflexus sp.]|uniref:response regulator n=1 Tax=Oligoflexus sp. TaxID=1971216 RepID=UPI002D682163|nr:response regulator [Oligoflexus sp.]HYX34196.1 response regulator [Oligoflexus sp.]
MFHQLKRILIVDDAEDFRALLSAWITLRGLQPVLAESGKQAIDILKTNPIDLIITDFQMPEMDGLDLLKWCRSHSIHIPVVFTSASRRAVDREQIALGDCCATRLNKPINFKILAAALNAAERHDHHRDCLHQPFKVDVEKESLITEKEDAGRDY